MTDANLVLGRLDPNNFAGGDIALSPALSQAALIADIGDRLGIAPQSAAIGICEMVDENMANAARVHAVENGKELGDFTMVAYGGGAPLHACRLCEKLGMNELIIPPGAGVGSAIGFLRAPFGYEAVRGAYTRLSQIDPEPTNVLLDGLTEESSTFAGGAGDDDLVIERKAFMRYRGQGWEIPVVLPGAPLGRDAATLLRSLFEAEYSRLFGRSLAGLDIEVMNWSVKAVSRTPDVVPVDRVAATSEAKTLGERSIYDPRSAGYRSSALIDRKSMATGSRISGPAAIVERETTTIVTAAFEAIMQADGSLLLQRKAVANA